MSTIRDELLHAREMVNLLRDEVESLTATNKRLNRRAQKAEAHIKTTVEDCRRQGVSLGRGLANAACLAIEIERDELRAELARTEADLAVAVEQAVRRGKAIDEVRGLHQPFTRSGEGINGPTCSRCMTFYPCRTIRALDGAE